MRGGSGPSAVRSALLVQRWRALFEEHGSEGLEPQRRGRSDWKVNDKVLNELEKLPKSTPGEHGYIRSRWRPAFGAGSSVCATSGVGRVRRCRSATRAGAHVCGRSTAPWPRARQTPTPRSSIPTRSTSTSIRESGHAGHLGRTNTHRHTWEEPEELHRRRAARPNRTHRVRRAREERLASLHPLALRAQADLSTCPQDRAHRRQLRHPQEPSHAPLAGPKPEGRAGIPARLLPVGQRHRAALEELCTTPLPATISTPPWRT